MPIDDLVFTPRRARCGVERGRHGSCSCSTNLTGRYNIWRMDSSGSWPMQLTQSDDNQAGFAVAPDGRTLFYTQDKGGNEQYDIYAVPSGGGAVRNLTNTADLRESGLLMAPDGRAIAMSTKRSNEGQNNLAVLDLASGKATQLTHETDPQWNWSAVAWVDGGRAIIANRGFTDGTTGEVWKVDTASGKPTRLLGKAEVVYQASDATRDGSAIAVTTNETTKQLHAAIYQRGTGAICTPSPRRGSNRAGRSARTDGRWSSAPARTDGIDRAGRCGVARRAAAAASSRGERDRRDAAVHAGFAAPDGASFGR